MFQGISGYRIGDGRRNELDLREKRIEVTINIRTNTFGTSKYQPFRERNGDADLPGLVCPGLNVI
jgi:hypothetical protein